MSPEPPTDAASIPFKPRGKRKVTFLYKQVRSWQADGDDTGYHPSSSGRPRKKTSKGRPQLLQDSHLARLSIYTVDRASAHLYLTFGTKAQVRDAIHPRGNEKLTITKERHFNNPIKPATVVRAAFMSIAHNCKRVNRKPVVVYDLNSDCFWSVEEIRNDTRAAPRVQPLHPTGGIHALTPACEEIAVVLAYIPPDLDEKDVLSHITLRHAADNRANASRALGGALSHQCSIDASSALRNMFVAPKDVLTADIGIHPSIIKSASNMGNRNYADWRQLIEFTKNLHDDDALFEEFEPAGID